MELIVFVVALCILGVLAQRFGHDSRMPADSKEQTLANLGLRPEGQRGARLDVQECVSQPQLEVSKRSAGSRLLKAESTTYPPHRVTQLCTPARSPDGLDLPDSASFPDR